MPTWRINKSLNVMVSCGIILYEIMSREERSGFARKRHQVLLYYEMVV